MSTPTEPTYRIKPLRWYAGISGFLKPLYTAHGFVRYTVVLRDSVFSLAINGGTRIPFKTLEAAKLAASEDHISRLQTMLEEVHE